MCACYILQIDPGNAENIYSGNNYTLINVSETLETNKGLWLGTVGCPI